MENVANNKNMPDGVETIEDLVRHSLEQDYNKANQVFGELMTDKLNTVLDQAKMKIAGNIYNGDPEDPEDAVEDDDFEKEESDEDIEDEEESDEDKDSNEHTHEDGTTHSHEGGDEEHDHDDEEIEGAAV